MKNNSILTEQNRTASRFNNYDLLRIVSTVAVILIHVNWHYFSKYAHTPSLTPAYVIGSWINIITRFCVPEFVMISGAFNLKNQKNGSFATFYKKTSWKIGVPTAGAILLFLIFDEIRAAVIGSSIISPIKGIVTGMYYNLWFLYMLAGLYLMTPLIIQIRNSISDKAYTLVGTILMLWAIISQAVSDQKIAYAIGVVFAFLGYYIVGDLILNKITLQHKNIFYLGIVVGAFTLTFVARFLGAEYYLSNPYTNFFSPTIAIASICIFAVVKQVNIKHDYSWLSGKTFYIYVFHTITYLTIFKLIEDIEIKGAEELAAILLVLVATFFISLICSVLYDKFWKARDSWKNKWYLMKIWDRIGALEK